MLIVVPKDWVKQELFVSIEVKEEMEMTKLALSLFSRA